MYLIKITVFFIFIFLRQNVRKANSKSTVIYHLNNVRCTGVAEPTTRELRFADNVNYNGTKYSFGK